ncbi:iron uptake system protein EfeO [Paenibacillus sp. FSL W8-1187]|uniref:iron uptake system protein EfeO n=1 Tax=Paenibacillus sp. FSL W8-1187 TaxID=2975339 RepID=UPI0030DA401A
MSTHSRTWAALCLGGLLLMSACSGNGGKNEAGGADEPLDSIKSSTAKLKIETGKLQKAIDDRNADETKRLGKEINDQWLSYENAVRQTFPLEYTEVEKYEMPVFSASAYDKIDFGELGQSARSLMQALDRLERAEPSKATSSELLVQAVAGYETFVKEQADALAAATAIFTEAVKSGDMERAKAEYVKARVYFETIEPVAESFGDLDPRIDARLADVEDESEWTGYHRIEKALWADGSLDGMSVYADQLVADTKELAEKVKAIKLDAKTMVAGSIELINEAATSKITGEEEIYSKTDLVDLAANVNGSKTVYLAIIPALNEHDPELASRLDAQFQDMEALLLSHREGDGYIAYDKLSTEQIRAISDKLSGLSDSMTQTAGLLG